MRFLFGFNTKNKFKLATIILVIFAVACVIKFDLISDKALNKDVPTFSCADNEVYVSGRLVGIYEKTKGVLVLDVAMIKDAEGNECSPCRRKIRSGDYIVGINGNEVNNKREIIKYIRENGRKPMLINIIRNGKKCNRKITPVLTEKGEPLVGLWIKDDLAGIGTMTYFTKDGEFGALGHGIGDGTTGDLLSISDGNIYKAQITNIDKGQIGCPGEIYGSIMYNEKNRLGKIYRNTDNGIFGELDKMNLENANSDKNDLDDSDFCNVDSDKLYKIATLDEVKEGEAFIFCEIDGTVKRYKIEITGIDQKAKENKRLLIKVTDKDLIAKTGGIVQGMSGSPIIQDDKLVGAITHVLVDDPASGYGIYIGEMQKNKK